MATLDVKAIQSDGKSDVQRKHSVVDIDSTLTGF